MQTFILMQMCTSFVHTAYRIQGLFSSPSAAYGQKNIKSLKRFNKYMSGKLLTVLM